MRTIPIIILERKEENYFQGKMEVVKRYKHSYIGTVSVKILFTVFKDKILTRIKFGSFKLYT